jgi:hypothetical protein
MPIHQVYLILVWDFQETTGFQVKAMILWHHLLRNREKILSLPLFHSCFLAVLEEEFFLAGELNTLMRLDHREDILVLRTRTLSTFLDDFFLQWCTEEKIFSIAKKLGVNSNIWMLIEKKPV